MDLDKAIKTRSSVRKYTSRTPDWRKIIEALDYARLAPLAGNIPTLKFLVVTEKDIIKQLAEACQQNFISQAKYVVVFCSDTTQIERSYGKRAQKYARQQAGAAIENFWLKLEDLGLCTCWIGAFVDDSVKRILKIPDNIEVEALFPIGYALGTCKQKPKTDLDMILFFNQWKNKFMIKPKEPEAV